MNDKKITHELKFILEIHKFYISAIKEIFAGNLSEDEFYSVTQKIFEKVDKIESRKDKADFLEKYRKYMAS